jgi:hypothetical protein
MASEAPAWASGAATGIGSLPYEDVVEATRTVFGELPDLPHLPELPGRGIAGGMIGRTCALLAELHVDLQPAGWRLTPGEGLDERRAKSLLAQDLDALEEVAQGFGGPLKVQVVGPWTLAASVERPKGDRVLADHGARRDLAQSLAEGLKDHLADVQRRVPGAQVLVQLDEPSLPAVLAAGIPTASGFSRHRAVSGPDARERLAEVMAVVQAAGAFPLVHSCAASVPFALLHEAGARGLSFDLRQITNAELEQLGVAVDDDVVLFVGAVPSVDPDPANRRPPMTDADVARQVTTFVRRLGFGEDVTATHTVITPACGLAGASPDWARRAMELARQAATLTKR